jgi:hypothetical protein
MRRRHPALAVHGSLSRGAFAVALLVSLAVLFAPADDVPASPPGVDKVVHLLLFAVLALIGRWAGARAGSLGVLLVVYAAVSELVQGSAALERSASVADWAADTAGVLAGLVAWAWAERHARP